MTRRQSRAAGAAGAAAQFWQIARRRGQEKAAVAVGHTILVIAWRNGD